MDTEGVVLVIAKSIPERSTVDKVIDFVKNDEIDGQNEAILNPFYCIPLQAKPSTADKVIEGAEHDETTQKPRFSTPSIPLQDLYSGVIDGAEHDETTQKPRFSTPFYPPSRTSTVG